MFCSDIADEYPVPPGAVSMLPGSMHGMFRLQLDMVHPHRRARTGSGSRAANI
jgi:hypothetical protein